MPIRSTFDRVLIVTSLPSAHNIAHNISVEQESAVKRSAGRATSVTGISPV